MKFAGRFVNADTGMAFAKPPNDHLTIILLALARYHEGDHYFLSLIFVFKALE
jgi:hypothetical protein